MLVFLLQAIRSAVKVFKKINCSNLKAVFGVEAGSEQTTDIDNGNESNSSRAPLSPKKCQLK